MKLTKREQTTLNQAANIMERMLAYDNPQWSLNSPTRTKEYLATRFAGLEREEFVVVFLDSQHKVIAAECLFKGTIDSASIYPREVVKAALGHNAAAVVLAHNHPSGSPEPSQADIKITNRLIEALNLMNIRTLDHIVVGAQDAMCSFAERGLI